jgi:hypothetical protein
MPNWNEVIQEIGQLQLANPDEVKVQKIIDTFTNHTIQKSHSRHISKNECQKVGLNISELETNPELQDAVLTTHHAFMHTFSYTYCVKIIENLHGIAYIEQAASPPSK